MDSAAEALSNLFIEFLQQHDKGVHSLSTSYYEMQIIDMINVEKTTLFVNFQDVEAFNKNLARAIEDNYYRFDPYLRKALKETVKQTKLKAYELERLSKMQDRVVDASSQAYGQEGIEPLEMESAVPKDDDIKTTFFVAFFNLTKRDRIRSMRTNTIGKLMTICGTVTRTSEVRPELLYGGFICTSCGTKLADVEQQFQYTPPHACANPMCQKGSFHLVMEDSVLVNWQRLRVQENADEIPAGSMPRCIDVICRNDIVEIAKAGDKMLFTGCAAVIPDAAKVGETTTGVKSFAGRGEAAGEGVHGLKAMGVRDFNYKMLFVACAVQVHRPESSAARVVSINELRGIENAADTADLSEEEQMDILRMRNTSGLYGKMADSICPTVHGHSEVKRGVLLMMLGGVHKTTHEGINLRGDINVCIIGDPSCAKSQFLKYVHGFLPRSIYTSGKSSSAAGLTASVVRDSETGEYCIEAGALMLADNGICCIDEFDKMDNSDQVAIHEAMEQQTISITKAGIQATLNARASILAAANPVFGRYDRSKPLKANVAVSAPIMSRFDLFFIIVDESNPELDEAIARHIVSVHQAGGKKRAADAAPFSTEQMQRYIRYARTINPTFIAASQRKIVECYRLLRQQDIIGAGKTAYRITVRQLESLIRLSEALARLHLDTHVQPAYVLEALRLLQKSIIFVETADVVLEDNEEMMEIERERDENMGSDGDDGNDGGDSHREHNNDYPHDHDNDQAKDTATDFHRADSTAEIGETIENIMGDHLSTDAQVKQESATIKVEKEKKPKVKMSREEYEKATQFFILFLKKMEEKVDGDEFTGCQWKELMSAYHMTVQSPETDTTVSSEQEKITYLILRRMVKQDGILIEVGEYSDDTRNEDKFLRLHPSQMEEF